MNKLPKPRKRKVSFENQKTVNISSIIARFGTQTEFGFLIGESRQTVNQWAKNNRIPGVHFKKILTIARNLNVPLSSDELIW